MNPETGTVDTLENWEADGYTKESAILIEVIPDPVTGDWIEAK